MTRPTVRELGTEHGAALLALSGRSTTGSEAFRVDRAPDFFAFGRMLGSTRYFGVFQGGVLCGSIGVSTHRRYVEGQATPVSYVHDLRVDPSQRSPRLSSILLDHAFEAYRASLAWCFATILDSNPHGRFIVRAAERHFRRSRALGHTAHLGRPLFRLRGLASSPYRVREATEREWETHYTALARATDFASAEPSHWRGRPGIHLIAYRGSELCAVAKAMSETGERRIVLGSSALDSRLARALSARFLRAPLPAPGEVLPHGHLAFLIQRPGVEAFDAFRHFLCKRADARWCFVFAGVAAEKAATDRWFGIRFTSTTYAFGNAPSELRMQAHELTLV
jgi:hypothetical protein